jgi:hypothetical protein
MFERTIFNRVAPISQSDTIRRDSVEKPFILFAGDAIQREISSAAQWAPPID